MMQKVICFVLLALGVHVHAAERVLLVVSSAGTSDDPERGYEFDELAQAYWVFADNGFDIDIASPDGGHPVSENISERWAFNQRFLADKVAMARISDTLRIDEVVADRYDAVFLIGGSGAAIDLPHDTALQAVLRHMAGRDAVIGAVCHGPAALLNVTIDGEPYLKARQVTSFTGEEEALFSKLDNPAESLEAQIAARGARFSEARVMGLHTVTDRRLVTGQNPFSTAITAEAVVRAMGKTPLPREAYRSENTVRVVQAAREQGKATAARRIAEDPAATEPMFLALLGYYEMEAAADDEALVEAMTLIEIALPYFKHERVQMALAGGYERLGQVEAARRVLRELLQDKPDFEPARDRLAALTP